MPDNWIDRVLVIGSKTPGFFATPFIDPINLDEFDVIIWEVSSVEIDAAWTRKSLPSFGMAEDFIKKILAKLILLEDWVKAGHSLILILDRPPLEFEYHDSLMRKRLRFVLNKHFPIPMAHLQRKSGTRIKATSEGHHFGLTPWNNRTIYEYIYSFDGRTDLAIVETAQLGNPQGVTSSIRHGNGQVIFGPRTGDASDHELRSEYYETLASLKGILTPKPQALPDWTEHFGAPAEAKLKHEIRCKSVIIKNIEEEIAGANSQLTDFNWLKILASGTGDEFLASARRALDQLGFATAKVAGHRTDLIARSDQFLLACETKGIERGGKEENLRQTLSWVSDVNLALVASEESVANDPHIAQCTQALNELGIQVGENSEPIETKGLLILGTYRKVPIDERNQPNFPADMLLNATRQKVCVMTSVQLINLILHATGDADKTRAARQRIFNTNGLLQMDGIPDQYLRDAE